MFRQLAHQLALLGVALTATLVLASADGEVPDADLEPNNKCCNPASPAPPGDAGCVTPCLDKDEIVCQGVKITSWNPGGCTTKEGAFCTDTKSQLFKPMFVCVQADCVREDGTPGKKCVWSFQGQSNQGLKKIKTCSGNPCG